MWFYTWNFHLSEHTVCNKKDEGTTKIILRDLVDLSSAYNTVNRKILYEILVRKGILTFDEVSFLQLLDECLYFDTNGTLTTLE